MPNHPPTLTVNQLIKQLSALAEKHGDAPVQLIPGLIPITSVIWQPLPVGGSTTGIVALYGKLPAATPQAPPA
mgnify:CR=1 FL=1